MGIHGIYKEIGPGRRVALSKLAADHYVAHSRPFRLAVDIAIWLFQIQSGKGGSNPALRTFYYRLLRLLTLNIHPVFVFDGPNKPTFKRNKKVGGPNVRVSSVPEFLAKQLLKHFGFPFHYAPGEAEAECALLQREGVVDAVLSEDVDTLMFGSAVTLRSWTPEQKSCKTPTHVNVHEAHKTKETSGLDRDGMILIAMMSGGDYITEGIPGCGPKMATEAARAGFGADLCRLDKKDDSAFTEWRDRLRHEIRTNESNFFRQKRPALCIPDDFPNREVLGYYTHPAISTPERLGRLRDSLKWDLPLDYPSLRTFTADAFDWRCIGGAKKFIRNLAPAILARELRVRGEAVDEHSSTVATQEASEAMLINAIHGKRTHPSTDSSLELRISFKPIQLVDIDLSIEDPDDEVPGHDEESEAEREDGDGECPGSPKKKRAPSSYDPTVHDKAWMLDTFVRLGVPLKVQDWEASAAAPKTKATRARRNPREKQTAGGMAPGALDRFTKVAKPGIDRRLQQKPPEVDELDLSGVHAIAKEKSLESNQSRRSRSRPAIVRMDFTETSNKNSRTSPKPSSKRPSPEPHSPLRRIARPRMASPVRKLPENPDIIEILSSPVKPVPPKRLASPPDIRHQFRRCSDDEGRAQKSEQDVPLPDTVTRRRKKSPLKRFRTAPVTGDDDMTSPVSRPTTPIAFAIDAIDLASPGSLPSLSKIGLFRKRQSDQPPDQSPSSRQEGIKRRSLSPDESSSSLNFQEKTEVVNVSSAMPTPPLDVETMENTDVFFARQVISASALLPVNKRLKDRTSETTASSNVFPLSTSTTTTQEVFFRGQPVKSAETAAQVSEEHTSQRISQRKATKISKKFIQPRDSLPGGWKEVELEVDLTLPTPPSRRLYRKSGVEEVDLTGD